MRSQHLYRLVVESWPTPDGRPFDRQSDEFWDEIADAFYNPSESRPWPEWIGDITEWFDDPGDSWTPPHRAWDKPGHYYESIGLVVPVVKRLHWQTRTIPERKARELRLWGCVVRIEKSDPITWSEK